MPDLASISSQNLFSAPLSSDEQLSFALSLKPFLEIIKESVNQNNSPFWNLTQWAVIKFFGSDEVFTRGLSFAFFLVAVSFSFLISSRLWSKKTAVWASLLTFFNPLFFAYSFEGLAYSALAAGVTGSMFFFVQGNLIGYVAMTTWALYSHHLALLIFAVQLMWLVYTIIRGRGVRAKRMIKGFLVVGLLYLPWLYPLYSKASGFERGHWVQPPDFQGLSSTILNYLSRGVGSPGGLPLVEFKLYNLALVVIVGIFVARKWHRNVQSSVFVLLWFLIPIIAAFAISQYFEWFRFETYIYYTIPASMILIASNRRRFSNVFLIILLVIYGVIDFGYFTSPIK